MTATDNNYKSEFTVHFETGNSYEVSIQQDVLTWKGLSGEDENMVQTVKVRHRMLAKNINIFQWKEQRGYFVTFVLDTLNKIGITSTKGLNDNDWLVAGKISNFK